MVKLKLCVNGVVWDTLTCSQYPPRVSLPLPGPVTASVTGPFYIPLGPPSRIMEFERVEGGYYELKVPRVS